MSGSSRFELTPQARACYDEAMNINDKRLGAYTRASQGKPAADPVKPAVNPVQPKVEPDDTSREGLLKVPLTGSTSGSKKHTDQGSSASGKKDSPYRKVAKFLLLVGTDEAAKIMTRLSPEQTERVVLEIASIRRVEKDEATVVLAEFESLLRKAREPSGGIETARTILETAFGPEMANDMLKKAVPDFLGKPFDYLTDLDADRVLRLISDELPAVKALVLSQIAPAKAASIIKLMTPVEKNETVIRLAKLKAINPDVIRRVDETMREKVLTIGTDKSDSIDGRSALAEILRRMDGGSEKAILSGIAEHDPDLGKDLRDRLFTIDDIVLAEDKFIQEQLRLLNDHDLAVLVAGKSDVFRNKIFSNITKNRGALVLEEEQCILPISRQESEKVSGAFFSVMRRAWERGEFFIRGRDQKEEWV